MSDSDQDDEEKAPETYTVEVSYQGVRIFYGPLKFLKKDDFVELSVKKHDELSKAYQSEVTRIAKVYSIDTDKKTIVAWIEICEPQGFGTTFKKQKFKLEDIVLQKKDPPPKTKKKRKLFKF